MTTPPLSRNTDPATSHDGESRLNRSGRRVSQKGCGFDGCGEPFYARGYCSGHYQQAKKGKTLRPLLRGRNRGGCSFEGCGQPHRANGLCAAHDKQLRGGRPLVPIGWTPPSPIRRVGDHAEVVLFDRKGDETACARIDHEDVALVSERRWHFLRVAGYAVTHDYENGRDTMVYMHKVICPSDQQVDHINGDRLDNRRANLIPVSPAENAQNVVRPGREADRNVYRERHSCKKPWRVGVQVNGCVHHGGSFATRAEARLAARKLRARLMTHHNEARHPFGERGEDPPVYPATQGRLF